MTNNFVLYILTAIQSVKPVTFTLRSLVYQPFTIQFFVETKCLADSQAQVLLGDAERRFSVA